MHRQLLPETHFDYVVTLCGHAYEYCPLFPGHAKVVHRGFDDPPKLAKNAATEEDALVHCRRVRDEIREFVADLPQNLSPTKEAAQGELS